MTQEEQIALIDCDPDVREALPQIFTALDNLLKTAVDANYQGERVIQLLRLQRADFFYRGIQNIAPTMDSSAGSIGWAAYGATAGQNNNTDNGARAYDYNPRMTMAYGQKFIAVLGQRPFYNCAAEAGDPKNDTDRRGARQVNLLIQMLQGQLDVNKLNLTLFYKLYKNGPVLGYGRPVTDGKKFGYNEVPNLVAQQHCFNCGTMTPGMPPGSCPQCASPFGPPNSATVNQADPNQPTLKFPKTSVVLDLLDGYTATWPFNVKELPDAPWIRNSCDKNRGAILKAHPQARKIVGSGMSSDGGGGTSDATARTVRATAQSQTGTVRGRSVDSWSDEWTWLDSATLELLDKDDERAIAKQLFPDGLRIVRIEGQIVAIKKEDYRQRLSECKPNIADYLFTDGGCWGMLGLEDGWSNLLNIMMETYETGITTFITNPSYVDADALNRNRYSPNRFTEAIPGAGENISNSWGTVIPASRPPDQINNGFQLLDSQIQNILGLLPQVYGQMPGNLTLGQARMMLTQGLMQLGTVAELATSFWEQSWTNLAKLYCEVAGPNPTYNGQTIDLDLIRKSNWVVKGGSSIPRSFAERVESLRQMLQETPQMAEQLDITNPVNRGKLRDYLDMPDFDDPDEDAMEAIKEIIDQLWQGQPMMGPPDPMTGQPSGPPQPSIPFDSLVYDPQVTSALCKASLLDVTGQQRQNTPGYTNVRAFLQAAVQAMAPPPPPPIQPKLTISAKIPDLTPEQEGAIFNDFNLNVPPPTGAASHPGGPQSHQPPPQGPPPPNSGPPSAPSGPGSPPLSGPGQLMSQPGAPGMDLPAQGPIQ